MKENVWNAKRLKVLVAFKIGQRDKSKYPPNKLGGFTAVALKR